MNQNGTEHFDKSLNKKQVKQNATLRKMRAVWEKKEAWSRSYFSRRDAKREIEALGFQPSTPPRFSRNHTSFV